MGRWRPAHCVGGRCEVDYTDQGDQWQPLTLHFRAVCEEHAKYPTDRARYAALQDETQSASDARREVAKVLDLRWPDGTPDDSGEQLLPVFDSARRVRLFVPAHVPSTIAQRLAADRALPRVARPRILDVQFL